FVEKVTGFHVVAQVTHDADINPLLNSKLNVIKIHFARNRPGNTFFIRRIECWPFGTENNLFLWLPYIALMWSVFQCDPSISCIEWFKRDGFVIIKITAPQSIGDRVRFIPGNGASQGEVGL